MYDPESYEDEPLIVRDFNKLRNARRVESWASRYHRDTHQCTECRASLTMIHSEPAVLHCLVCNCYRLYLPRDFSPFQKLKAKISYRASEFKRKLMFLKGTHARP